MLIKVEGRNLYNFLLLARRYCIFRKAIGIASARLDLDKNKVIPLFCDQIDFAILTAKVAL